MLVHLPSMIGRTEQHQRKSTTEDAEYEED